MHPNLPIRSVIAGALCCFMGHTMIGLALVVAFPSYGLSADEPISFRTEIAPILLEHCVSCHGPKKAEGGYRLDSFAQLSKPGDSGIAPLKLDEASHVTELVRRITTSQADERMPADREPLDAAFIKRFERWQADGMRLDSGDPQTPLFELVPPKVYAEPPVHYRTALPITALTFTPDGKQILVGGYHELHIWNVEDGSLVRRIANLPERITSMAWSNEPSSSDLTNSNPGRLAVAGGSPGHIGEVRIIDWSTGVIVQSLGRAQDLVQVVRFQPGGSLLATGNNDGTLRWYDMNDGRLIRSIAGHADCVNDIAWSADGKRLASASRDKTAKVFEVESGELLATYSAHGDTVTGICFLESGKELTSVGGDRKVHRWQMEDAKSLAKVDIPATIQRLHVNGSRGWLALTDRSVRGLELTATKPGVVLEGHTAWVASLAVHTGSSTIATGSLNGELRLWNLEEGKLLRHWIAKP